jgi:PAS domain S-box-containing protein
MTHPSTRPGDETHSAEETATGAAQPSGGSQAAAEQRGLGAAESVGHLLRSIANYAVFATDAGGHIGDWNAEAARLFGYESADVFGRHLSLFCVEDSARALQKIFAQAKEQGSARYYQWMTRKDGTRLYARVAVFALTDNSRVHDFLFLLRDDSREPNLRQLLREKEQMAAIGTAASILAHEIGNPLNGISATVQLLEHCLSRPTPPAAETMLSSVQDLKSEVRRLTELLSEFKNIAWPQKLALGPVDLKRLIQQLAGEIEKRSLRQGVEVALECQADLPLLNGDDDKLKQALLHVLDNALDAMPHGGRLEIKAYRKEQTICVDIIDNGVGIPKNLKVFDLFSSTKPDGVGLGLFLVQQIVLAHDGAITYSSTPGQGTTFHVTFSLNPSPDTFGADFIDLI